MRASCNEKSRPMLYKLLSTPCNTNTFVAKHEKWDCFPSGLVQEASRLPEVARLSAHHLFKSPKIRAHVTRRARAHQRRRGSKMDHCASRFSEDRLLSPGLRSRGGDSLACRSRRTAS